MFSYDGGESIADEDEEGVLGRTVSIEEESSSSSEERLVPEGPASGSSSSV
ncbi:hypothetical protein FRC02_008570 [Tulasnella sp. 418]|nr:hypothetical protein FRC02_008570 [Tulasnella sp. 418]